MGLSCDSGGDSWNDGDWWWHQPKTEAPLSTKRSRECCSCGERIRVGDVARKIERERHATDWEEIHGFDCDVSLADWYLCEKCGDLADSLSELGFCYSLGGESLKQQIEVYRAEEKSTQIRAAEYRARTKVKP